MSSCMHAADNGQCITLYSLLMNWAVSTADECPGKKDKLQNYYACVYSIGAKPVDMQFVF